MLNVLKETFYNIVELLSESSHALEGMEIYTADFGISALIAATIFAAGTASSIVNQRKAAKKEKEASRRQQRIDQLKEQREIRRTTQEALIKRAQAAQSAVNQGAAGSAVEGGTASIASQLGGNISFLGEVGQLQLETSNLLQSAADSRSRASTGAAVADLGATIFSADLSTIFQGGDTPAKS